MAETFSSLPFGLNPDHQWFREEARSFRVDIFMRIPSPKVMEAKLLYELTWVQGKVAVKEIPLPDIERGKEPDEGEGTFGFGMPCSGSYPEYTAILNKTR
ncbi:hypothetical protein IV203_034347 [Nitzschia inconspicua]|uniref:Uncharacterized protein n=1 Tax=Nitzschia inconspicua TaxID=303405 RepID=A0A9K3M4K2_9STRA|nr:hypothetical protein IV203_022819 [Nitzschia inconspicua]KAG7373623.1 hypothetical protein IV203_034347 [Nitzschia inconspicua]